MEKRYEVTAELSGLERISLLTILGLLFICWFCVYCSMFFEAVVYVKEYAGVAIGLSLAALCVAGVRLILAREMLLTFWSMSDAVIGKKGPRRIVTMEFNHVISFRYYRFPPLFGFGIIKHREGMLFLSFRIHDLAGLVRAAQKGIDGTLRSGVYDAQNINDYCRIARAKEARNDRMKRYMPYLVSSLIVSLSVAIVTALFLWHFPIAVAFVWAIVVLAIYLFAILGAEATLSFTREQLSGQVRDASGVYVLSGIIALVACLCLGIFVSSALAL